MAVYGSMLVPTKSRTTNTGQGYTARNESYTPGQNVSARLSDSASGIISSTANQQAQSLGGLVRGINQANQGLTDAYIDHNRMVGQNMATEYRQRVNDALYGENGILTREGESSFSCRQDAEAKMKEISDELQKGYEGSLASNFFRQQTDTFISDTTVKAQQYQDKQYGKWMDDGDTAFITQSVDLAVSSYADSNAFSRHLGEATNRIRAMGRRNGINDDMIEKNVRDQTSAAFLQSVKQAIGDKNLEAAQRILKQGMTVHRDANPHDLSKPEGLVTKATADFNNRKVFRTKDEEGNEVIKTVQTMTLEMDDGKFIVLPTIIDGKEYSPEDAIAHSKKTGEHFGIFDSQAHADDFAQKLHENHAVQYGPGRIYMNPADITQAKAVVQHEIDRRAAEAERAALRAERARAASVRSLTSGKEWKDAVYRAENMNDTRGLVELQGKLRSLGENGMADAIEERISVTSYISKNYGTLKDLPIQDAAQKLEDVRLALGKAEKDGDIKAHRLLSATYDQLSKQIGARVKAFADDPGAASASVVQEDFAANSDAHPQPTLAEECKARVEVQRRNGVLPDRVKPLSKRELEVHLSDFNTAADKSTYLRGLEQRYGDAWPMVYRQIAQSGKFPKNLQMIANLPPVAASIASSSSGNASYFHSVASTMPDFDQKAQSKLKGDVSTALAPAIKTMTLAGDMDGAAMVESTATNLAVTYVSQGMSPTSAARRAASECMNDRYTLAGTYRIPKEHNADRVKKGVNIAVDNLLSHPERLPLPQELTDYYSQFSPAVAKSKMSHDLRRHITVTTNADESGVDIRFDGALLRDGNTANSLGFTFEQLSDMKRERVSSTESDKLTDEAKAVRPWH